ncbi:universal stress protein PHOS32 [Malania oleifera]|uniref:universal stress protein PHOS32 n=1 Tax=Malania oleifera TaxID=397392 RepID=UPI0025AE1849|nr:universal stress protein PHOS32 [Malania oleifera]
MGRTGGGVRLPGFCLNRIRSHVRVRSPPIQSNLPEGKSPPESDVKKEETPGAVKAGEEAAKPGGAAAEKPAGPPGPAVARRIMIVVDSSLEAKGAMHWALSHTVQTHDTVVLLHFVKTTSNPKPPAKGDVKDSKDPTPRIYELLYSTKRMCQLKKPEVQVEVVVAEGKEKGPTIVERAKREGVALLVLGQKKASMTWRLLSMWAGYRVGCCVDYCINHSHCMAIAVRRKSKKVGGYLITTKRHKDFWLLA